MNFGLDTLDDHSLQWPHYDIHGSAPVSRPTPSCDLFFCLERHHLLVMAEKTTMKEATLKIFFSIGSLGSVLPVPFCVIYRHLSPDWKKEVRGPTFDSESCHLYFVFKKGFPNSLRSFILAISGTVHWCLETGIFFKIKINNHIYLYSGSSPKNTREIEY